MFESNSKMVTKAVARGVHLAARAPPSKKKQKKTTSAKNGIGEHYIPIKK